VAGDVNLVGGETGQTVPMDPTSTRGKRDIWITRG
jgi:hypothetical protein